MKTPQIDGSINFTNITCKFYLLFSCIGNVLTYILPCTTQNYWTSNKTDSIPSVRGLIKLHAMKALNGVSDRLYPGHLKAGRALGIHREGGSSQAWVWTFSRRIKSILPLRQIAPSVAEPSAFSVSRFARHSVSETNSVDTGTYCIAWTYTWSRTWWLFLSITQGTVGNGKGKFHSRTGHEGPDGEETYSSTLSLTSALDRGGWSTPRPGRFTPGKDPVPIVWEAGWVPRAGLDRCRKPRSPHRDSIPGPSNP